MKRTLANLIIGLSLLIATSSGAFAADKNERIQSTHQVNYSSVEQEGLIPAGEPKKAWRCGILNPGYGPGSNRAPWHPWYRPRPAQGSDLHWSWEDWQREIGWFPYSRNHANVVPFYPAAAGLRHSRAQMSLGMMYASGKGAPKDFRKANRWFILSMSNYNKGPPTRSYLSSRPMTTAEISKAKTVVRECIAKNFNGC